MKTSVIFGVTGQDGSYLAELLLSEGYSVVGVRRRSSAPNDERIRHLYQKANFRVVEGDVTDPFSVRRIIESVDPQRVGWGDWLEVYNLAAQSHVKTSFDEPAHTTQVDYLGCLNILETIRSLEEAMPAGANRIRFYQASSSEMFGASASAMVSYSADGPLERVETSMGYSPHSALLFQDEHTPMLPCSPYAIAKLAAHHAVRLYRESYGTFACSGILYNHESERRGEQFVTRKITQYVARWYRARKEGVRIEPLKLGNLKASRDWGHAEDYVRAMWMMLQRTGPGDYVVATGETHTVEDFLLRAFSAAGYGVKDASALPVEVDHNLFRPSEVPYLRGDAGKARRELGWEPRTSFDGLVERMVYSDMDALGLLPA